jgi:hypothetical protein
VQRWHCHSSGEKETCVTQASSTLMMISIVHVCYENINHQHLRLLLPKVKIANGMWCLHVVAAGGIQECSSFQDRKMPRPYHISLQMSTSLYGTKEEASLLPNIIPNSPCLIQDQPSQESLLWRSAGAYAFRHWRRKWGSYDDVVPRYVKEQDRSMEYVQYERGDERSIYSLLEEPSRYSDITQFTRNQRIRRVIEILVIILSISIRRQDACWRLFL